MSKSPSKPVGRVLKWASGTDSSLHTDLHCENKMQQKEISNEDIDQIKLVDKERNASSKPRSSCNKQKDRTVVSDKVHSSFLDELEFCSDHVDVNTIPSDLFPWEYIQYEPDVIYLLLLHLCEKNHDKVIQRQSLIRLTFDVVKRAGKKAFTSQEAKTPLATYSATFTKAMRNRPGKTVGKLLGMLETISIPSLYRSLWYRPYIRPGKWNEVRHYFHRMMMERAEDENLSAIPNIKDKFYISKHKSVHGYGVFARERIPANTSTWLYYMGGIYKAWERPDHPSKISYRFAVNGMPYLLIDPTDEKGDFTDGDRQRFVCANVNEARGSRRANCFFTFNPHQRWQVFIQIGKKDIRPDEELLVESYGSRDIDPQQS